MCHDLTGMRGGPRFLADFDCRARKRLLPAGMRQSPKAALPLRLRDIPITTDVRKTLLCPAIVCGHLWGTVRPLAAHSLWTQMVNLGFKGAPRGRGFTFTPMGSLNTL